MELDDKYKTHLIRNLTNKQTKYMPSINSISDLSLDRKNKRWSRRWNQEVQSGAGNSYEYDDYDYTSESLDDVNEDSGEDDTEDTESSSQTGINKKTNSNENELNSVEFERYRIKVKNQYKKLYQKKYGKFKDILKTIDIDKICNNHDSPTVDALTGLSFWPYYNESLKKANNKHDPKDLPLKEPLLKQISDNCYKLDTKGLCPKCKYNHVKDCEDICNSSKYNGLDVLVTRSKSGKVIDSFRVNLDPRSVNKTLLNSINICVKSNLGRMDAYKSTNKCIESGIVKSPLIKVEPTFKNNYPNIVKYSEASNIKNCKKPGCIIYNQKPGPRRNTEANVGNSHGLANETIDNVKSHNPGTGYSDIHFNRVESTNLGAISHKISESNGLSVFGRSPKESTQLTDGRATVKPNHYKNINSKIMDNDNNVYDTVKSTCDSAGCKMAKSRNPDVMSGYDSYSKNVVESSHHSNNVENNNYQFNPDHSMSKTVTERFDVPPDYSTPFSAYNYGPTLDYYEDASYEFDELTNLIRGTERLHGFKINNRGVNVPLFLNIGTIEGVYSGQAFLSNTKIGLFKISIVEPIEPKVNIASKIFNLVGLNNYRESSCKCTNLTPALALKKVLPSTGEVVDNVFNRLEGYKHIPWISPLKTYLHEQIDNVAKAVNDIEDVEINICDFHKNLFGHRVDRTRFGKDVFCQLKYVSTIGTDVTLRVEKQTFTSGSNVSSFFNGFHEQLLCVASTSRLNKLDLYNSHRFTFIIRRVKGSRYGRNFTILNTTSGQHLCLDMLTHELRFEEECKFSKYLVPAIFKIIPLPDIVEAVSNNTFNFYKPVVSLCSDPGLGSGEESVPHPEGMQRYPTFMSTTDQYINAAE